MQTGDSRKLEKRVRLLSMGCTEKKELQENCTAAFDEFERVTQQIRAAAGVVFDLRTKTFERAVPRVGGSEYPGGKIRHTAEFAELLAEAGRKRKTASSALSRHLAKHRC